MGKASRAATTGKQRKAAVATVARKPPNGKTVGSKPAPSPGGKPIAAKHAAGAKALALKARVAKGQSVVRPVVTKAAAAQTVNAKPARPPQAFTVSHLNEADFKADGLRTYALYRDLGIAAATAGLCQAHVIRFVPPTTNEVRKRHTHAVDLQLVYVLKGWMKNEFEGVGEQMMSTGSCWLQPSWIRHTVLEYSADCEVLEIVVPADFKTQELG